MIVPDWTATRVSGGFLVKVPNWLSPDDLILDTDHWESQRGINVSPWKAMELSYPLPPQNRVLITIRDFPLAFWLPFYFRQATASMGKLAGYVQSQDNGDSKSFLRLLLDCHDTNLIPTSYHTR